MFTEECIVGSKVGLRDVIFPFCVGDSCQLSGNLLLGKGKGK